MSRYRTRERGPWSGTRARPAGPTASIDGDGAARPDRRARRHPRSRGPRRRPRRAAPGLAQLPWRRLVNPFRPVEILSADQVEAIHRASLRILAEIGMEVLGDRALDAFAAAGATVDRPNRRGPARPGPGRGARRARAVRVRAPRPQPGARRRLRWPNLVFGAVGGPAFVSDLDRGRRAGNFADFVDYVRVIGALDIIHQEGGGPLEPTDLPVETRHLDMYRTLRGRARQDLAVPRLRRRAGPTTRSRWPASSAASTATTLLREPSLMTVINTNSPLRLDGPMSDGLIEMAIHGQPVVATPFTLAGAMSPVSLAGALAQQNAEALFLVALAQIVRPGAPMVYGAFTSNVDMRTGAPAFGTPEYVKGALASGQMARRYGLPWRSSNATASNVVDAQAAYESEMAVWGAVMGGVNLLYQGAGWLEGGLTASFEKLIIDAEILQMMAEVLQPDPGRRGQPRLRGDRRRRARAATSSARPTPSSATRPRSTGRSSRTGATSRRGRRTAPGRATERANAIWKRLLAEADAAALDPASPRRSTPSSPAASARSSPTARSLRTGVRRRP